MGQLGRGRLPADRASVRLHMVDEPDGLTVGQGAIGEGIDKVVHIIRSAMSDYPWRGHLNLRPPAEPAANDAPQRVLKLEWQRVRLSAAHGFWRWNGEPVAATLFLGGHDPDDARTMASFAQAGELRLPVSWLKRVRESARPLLATAYLRPDAAHCPMIARFALGLGSALCVQANITRQCGPLGDALPRDFPPQFLHVIAAQGMVRKRLWPEAATFRGDENVRQVLSTFNDRLEDSFRQFEERLAIGTGNEQISVRLRWQGVCPTAGLAEIIDGKCVRHELLLVGRKDAAGDHVCRQFARRFPSRGWEKIITEIRSAPLPMLATVTRTAPPERYGAGATLVAGALAAAFFRRINAF